MVEKPKTTGVDTEVNEASEAEKQQELLEEAKRLRANIKESIGKIFPNIAETLTMAVDKRVQKGEIKESFIQKIDQIVEASKALIALKELAKEREELEKRQSQLEAQHGTLTFATTGKEELTEVAESLQEIEDERKQIIADIDVDDAVGIAQNLRLTEVQYQAGAAGSENSTQMSEITAFKNELQATWNLSADKINSKGDEWLAKEKQRQQTLSQREADRKALEERVRAGVDMSFFGSLLDVRKAVDELPANTTIEKSRKAALTNALISIDHLDIEIAELQKK